MYGRTNERTSRNQYAPHFFKVGGIITFFLKFAPGILLIILYQLTKFEAPSCNTFQDITITNFQRQNLQREIMKNII